MRLNNAIAQALECILSAWPKDKKMPEHLMTRELLLMKVTVHHGSFARCCSASWESSKSSAARRKKSLAVVYTAGRKANIPPQNLQTSPKCEADGAARLMRAGPSVL